MAVKWRDELRAVEAAADMLDRHDTISARRRHGRWSEWSGGEDRKFGAPTHISDGEGGSGDTVSVVPEEELREIRRAHPDPEDDTALQARIARTEAGGKIVSRWALREEVRRERQAAAEIVPQDTPAADPQKDGSSTPCVPTDAAAVPVAAVAATDPRRGTGPVNTSARRPLGSFDHDARL